MSINTVAGTMNAALKSQAAQALVVQTYCNSVLQQPLVNFPLYFNPNVYDSEINSQLTLAKNHADTYINNIMPALVNGMDNVSDFYNLYMSVPAACPQGTPVAMWLDVLNTIGRQADNYLVNCQALSASFNALNMSFDTDVSGFGSIAINLNTTVNGNAATLQSIGTQLDSIQGQIDTAMAGTARDATAVAGTSFMAIVGPVADIVIVDITRQSASNQLVMGGVALVATGASGQAASVATLSALDKQKQGLLTNPAGLAGEVTIALGISSAYKSLGIQFSNLVTEVRNMQIAWQTLSTDINNLVSDLQNGILAPDVVRTLFMADNNSDVSTLLADVNIIKNQLAGINVKVSPTLLSTTLDGIANGATV